MRIRGNLLTKKKSGFTFWKLNMLNAKKDIEILPKAWCPIFVKNSWGFFMSIITYNVHVDLVTLDTAFDNI